MHGGSTNMPFPPHQFLMDNVTNSDDPTCLLHVFMLDILKPPR